MPELLLLLALFLALIPCRGRAQRTLGVQWDAPADTAEAALQLERFREAGISTLELEQTVSSDIWNLLKRQDFNVFVQVPVRFPVVETFSSPDSALIAKYKHYLAHYAGREIAAFGVFEYGQMNSGYFPAAAQPILRQIENVIKAPTYFKDWSYRTREADTLAEFKMVRIAVDRNFHLLPDSSFKGQSAFLYRPDPSLSQMVRPLKWFLEKTSVNPKAVLFFNSGWLLGFMENHPETVSVLRRYATEPEPVFPLPRESLPPSSRYSGIVLILLLLWGSLAINYNFEPTYRKSLFRYFLSHKFFVEDVMNRQIRLIIPNLLILIQHAIMGGIFLYCLTATFFSTTGIEAIYYHIPGLSVFGADYFNFFLLGMSATLLFELICLSWLYLLNRKLKFISQAATLYSWSLQINFLVTTILVTLLSAGSNSFLSVFLYLFFMAVLLAAFPLAAYDAGQSLTRYRVWYTVGTIGLYILLVGSLFVWIYGNSYLMNIIDLASAIS